METTEMTVPATADELDHALMLQELADSGHDLPDLADTMEAADARVVASRFLGAMRGVQREWGANEAEYKTLAAFERRRHDERQGPLERQLNWLHEAVKTLFGFMRPAGKKKSLNLIHGRVGMRAQTDELVVEDDKAVISWAQEQQVPGIVKVTLSLDRKGLRDYVENARRERVANAAADEPTTEPDSVPPPNVTLKARPDQFYATPAKD